jgi:hypothetical protein
MRHEYTAGLFDGEGTVAFSRQRVTAFRAPMVSIPSCTFALVKFLKQTYGGNISTKRTYKTGHQKSYVWALRYDAALKFLAAILPHLKEPEKIRRAKMLVEEYKGLTLRNGRYSPQQLKLKRQFEKRFFRYTRKKR